VDTALMRYFVCPRKIKKMRAMARSLFDQARIGRRWVSREKLRTFAGTCVSLTLAMPYARLFTRAIYDDLGSGRGHAPTNGTAARNGARVRLSHQSHSDLRTLKRLTSDNKEGRPMQPVVPDRIMHSDAAEVGYGGTLDFDGRPGYSGLWESQGVWRWRDRAQNITVRELRAVRMLLQGMLGQKSQVAGMKLLRLCVDNTGVVAVTNAFVPASREMMRELRRLKKVLDSSGIRLATEWIPSAANKFADALSRRFPIGDVRIRETLKRSFADGLQVPLSHFPYRTTLGEHPVYARQRAYEELASTWSPLEVRMLCPPVDLLAPIVRKIRRTRAPTILLMPEWPVQPWHIAAMHLANRSLLLEQNPSEVWVGHRVLNPKWKLRLLEMNMPSPAFASPSPSLDLPPTLTSALSL
jgi:hypothetical protein